MADASYRRALLTAGLLAPGGIGRGITPWRAAGLRAARLMVRTFLEQVATTARPAETEHPFLDPRDNYDPVFGDYANVYRLPGDGGAGWVLRADNLHRNVAWLRRTGHPGPVVSTSGLLRQLRGGGTSLFRDRYIWPAVQLSHLLPAGTGGAALDEYRRIVEATFAAFALPVLTVEVDAPGGYGDVCHLTLSCLRDGRLTVVATTYLMAGRYRQALGVTGELVDIGFTGKALALMAMHHRDRQGLQLPSAVAPVQLGILTSGDADARAAVRAWLPRMPGVRTELVDVPGEPPYRRHRAERALLRRGTPLVAGVRDGTWRLTQRGPAMRLPPAGRAPGPAAIRAELDAYDDRLRRAAHHRFDRGAARHGALSAACAPCTARNRLPVFGRIVPARAEPCAACGGAGLAAVLSEHGRFY